MDAVITYSDYYIPEKALAVTDYVRDLPDSFVLSSGLNKDDLLRALDESMGIQYVYFEDRRNEPSIFCSLLDTYFAATQTKPSEIDFIIYTHGNSIAVGDPWALEDQPCVNVPYYLRDSFEMLNAQVFNVEQECAGTFVAARLGLSLVRDGSARKILVLSTNFFETPQKRLMAGPTLVSDGLALLEISSNGRTGYRLRDASSTTDGSITRVRDFALSVNWLKAVDVGSKLIRSIIEKNGLEMRDISYIIPQNISRNGAQLYSYSLRIPLKKIFTDNVSHGGHMGDVDLIRNITDVHRRNLLQAGHYAVAYGVSTGTSWNVLLLEKL